jgi:hypothetical protein
MSEALLSDSIFSNKNNIFDVDQLRSYNLDVRFTKTHSLRAFVSQSIDTLREIALVHLQYAVLDINMIGDRASVTRAMRHSRDAEACLKLILKEMTEDFRSPNENLDKTI